MSVRLTLLIGLSATGMVWAAPPEPPPVTPAPAPAVPGSSTQTMAPLPIDPPTPASTPLLPAATSGAKGGAEAALPSQAGTLGPRSFRSLDSDADGSLTAAEAGADPVLRENFARFDSNGDGRLSRDEFASYQPGPGDAAGD
ncbi:EF-hand domain-containing protein [Xanthomonas campestris]|uniref:EF-hand domain-containing protein n=1 Tax=Xanthomonas campestris TaxID=339 RepID=UPI003CEA553C